MRPAFRLLLGAIKQNTLHCWKSGYLLYSLCAYAVTLSTRCQVFAWDPNVRPLHLPLARHEYQYWSRGPQQTPFFARITVLVDISTATAIDRLREWP